MEDRFKAATKKKKKWKCGLNAGYSRQKSPAVNIAVILQLEKNRMQGPNPHCREILVYSECMVNVHRRGHICSRL